MKNHELRVFINCIVWMLLDSFQTSWKIIHPCKVQTTCHFIRLSGSIVGPLFFHHFWSCTPWHDEKPVPRNSYDLQGFNARIFFQSMIQLCCGLTFFGIRADANEKLEETWPPPLLSVKSPQFHFSRFCIAKNFPLISVGVPKNATYLVCCVPPGFRTGTAWSGIRRDRGSKIHLGFGFGWVLLLCVLCGFRV